MTLFHRTYQIQISVIVRKRRRISLAGPDKYQGSLPFGFLQANSHSTAHRALVFILVPSRRSCALPHVRNHYCQYPSSWSPYITYTHHMSTTPLAGSDRGGCGRGPPGPSGPPTYPGRPGGPGLPGYVYESRRCSYVSKTDILMNITITTVDPDHNVFLLIFSDRYGF
ncbi:hypothetical protein BGX38DRAFT_1208614 [Terfezia claveryi]|nr:hypothetical protein BGX38DRAFT_1208614 [Terfezia claveryi]